MGQGESAIKGFAGGSSVKFGGGTTDQAKTSTENTVRTNKSNIVIIGNSLNTFLINSLQESIIPIPIGFWLLVETFFEEPFFFIPAYMRGVSLMNPKTVAVETPVSPALLIVYGTFDITLHQQRH
jgi:hypothetical protein